MEACLQAAALTDTLRDEPQTLGETNLYVLLQFELKITDMVAVSCKMPLCISTNGICITSHKGLALQFSQVWLSQADEIWPWG